MKSRKFAERIRSTNNRKLHQKHTPSSSLKAKINTILQKETIPKRILLVGTPSKREKGIAYLENRLRSPFCRIDLATVISKYVGQTEKSLKKAFSKAERKDWILLFDEADALFGKRTEIEDAHDRYENADTAWILERIQDHEGLVILASNGKSKKELVNRFKIKEIVETDTGDEE
ncbi:MAG: ATP-binding protein [Candidatus Lokiarchaeota archaeon]|nr:ATP-binding protein [Candidatus Lokiarchaeota archaeon]